MTSISSMNSQSNYASPNNEVVNLDQFTMAIINSIYRSATQLYSPAGYLTHNVPHHGNRAKALAYLRRYGYGFYIGTTPISRFQSPIDLSKCSKRHALQLCYYAGLINQNGVEVYQNYPKDQIISILTSLDKIYATSLCASSIDPQDNSRNKLDNPPTPPTPEYHEAPLSNPPPPPEFYDTPLSNSPFTGYDPHQITTTTTTTTISTPNPQTPSPQTPPPQIAKFTLPNHIALRLLSPDDSCMICMDNLTKDTIAVSSCGHFYCKDCIAITLAQPNPKCGNCRTDFK